MLRIAVILRVFFLLSIFVPLCMLAHHSFVWLQTGSWTHVPVLAVLGWTLPADSTFWSWLAAPDSWVGLHVVVSGFLRWPLFVGIFVFGMVGSWVGLILVAKMEDTFLLDPPALEDSGKPAPGLSLSRPHPRYPGSGYWEVMGSSEIPGTEHDRGVVASQSRTGG